MESMVGERDEMGASFFNESLGQTSNGTNFICSRRFSNEYCELLAPESSLNFCFLYTDKYFNLSLYK